MRNTIQLHLILGILLLFSQFSIAQTPQAFNYQGVAREASGNPISNRTIGCLFSITFRSADGFLSTTYAERHVLTTSNDGLFSTQIGTGTPVSALYHFNEINWGAAGSYFLELAIDMSGGSSYLPVGEPTRLVSVPYALHAATCDEVLGGVHWGDYPVAPGAIVNTNEQTVIVSPDNCCTYFAPAVLNSALVVNGDNRETGAYFTTSNLGLDASAIKAEIIGAATHSDPVAVRGKAIVTDTKLGNGGWGAEFIGGEAGVVCEGQMMGLWARSATGTAGKFDGDVTISKNLAVEGVASAQKLEAVKKGLIAPQLSLAKKAVGNIEAFNLTAFQGDSRKLEWGFYTAAETGGVTYQALNSVDRYGRTAIGTNDAGSYALRVQQNNNLGFALTSNGAVNSSWEMFVGGADVAGKKPLVLYAGNAFVGQFNPSTGAYTAFSDLKFKKDIRPMPQTLLQVKQLNLVSYQTQQDASGSRHNGVIAQELEQVFPEYVTVGQDRDGNEVRSVDYAGLSIVALKAIQEQQQRIEKLEKSNAALLARLEKLEAKR